MRGPIKVSEMLLAALSSDCALFRLSYGVNWADFETLLNDGQ